MSVRERLRNVVADHLKLDEPEQVKLKQVSATAFYFKLTKEPHTWGVVAYNGTVFQLEVLKERLPGLSRKDTALATYGEWIQK